MMGRLLILARILHCWVVVALDERRRYRVWQFRAGNGRHRSVLRQ